jgi:hypothetical protein
MDHAKFRRAVLAGYVKRVGEQQTGDLMAEAALDALGASQDDADVAAVLAHIMHQRAALEALQDRLAECEYIHPALLLVTNPRRFAEWVLASPDDDAQQLCIRACDLDLPQLDGD